jgi:hypothetical protein
VTRLRALLLLLALAAVAAIAPATAAAASAGTSATASAAAKRKVCKKGYKVVKVRTRGRVRSVCRRRRAKAPAARQPAAQPPAPAGTSAPAGPAGPSVAEVESIIRGQLQAQAPYPLPAEAVEVLFERQTQVMPMVMYNPYEADPLTATGKVETWPVRAWVKAITHRDATPEDDTNWGGCLGHLNSYWPYDSLYMFFRGQSGEWTFLTSSANPGDCG